MVILGVHVVLADDRGGTGIVCDPRTKERVAVPAFAVDDMTNDAAQERDIRARADRRIDISDRAGAGETRIDVNKLCTVFDFCGHWPFERDRVILSHVRTHDDNAIGILHAARIHSRRATAESCPQTGDTGAMSDTGLILNRDDAEPTHEFLVYVIPFDVE